MSWRVLDFTSFNGRISYERGRIKAMYRDGSEKMVSLAEIAVVVIADKTDVSSGLLSMLGQNGIPVIVTDWRGVPVSVASGWSTHTRVGARQIAQANMTLPRRKAAWANIVRAKVRGQASTIRALGHAQEAKDLVTLASTVRSGDPSNVEAQAARLYWSAYFSEGESRDQEGNDLLNAALNYGYTILRGHCIRAVTEAGLWPALGVFHHSRSNGFNLVDDLLEPFRPTIDYYVAQLPGNSAMDDPETRRKLVSASSSQFHADGRTVSTMLGSLAQQFGLYAEGDIQQFRVPTWCGPFKAEE